MMTTLNTTPRSDYITLIAVHRFLVAGLALIGALAVAVFGMLPVLLAVQDFMAVTISVSVLAFALIVCLLLAAASLVVGLGLLRQRAWARWAEIALAVLNLASFPIGTIIGVLILIYLLGDDGRAAFAQA